MAKVPPGSFSWCCGRCGTWNPIEKGVCTKCNSMVQDSAKAFRVENILTSEEKNFYTVTAPMILDQLMAIKELLLVMVGRTKP